MRLLKPIINLTLVVLLIWFLVAQQQKILAAVASRDSIQYWATGKLLLHRQNPYSVVDVEALESSAGWASKRPLMFRCPPWALWLVMLPGLLSAYWAWVVWLAVLFASLITANRISWKIYGDGGHPPLAFVIAGYAFAPVAACLVAGQIGLLLLLGIMIFLAYESDQPFLAGAALIVPMAKPHLFALFWPILAIWTLRQRKWRLLAGFAFGFAMAVAVAFAFDFSVLGDYRAMLRQQAIQNEFIPSLSGMIRALVFHIAIPGALDRSLFLHRFFWVQFVPLALGLVWTAWYYWENRESWMWRSHGVAVLVVTVLTTPYAWMTDEVVLLPAILQGVLWVQRAKLKLGSHLAILLFLSLDLLLLLIVKAQVPPSTGIYFWSSLVWASWYWFARSFRDKQQESILPQEAATAQVGS